MASVTEEMTVNSKFLSKPGSSKLRQSTTTDASPDSKCPICLDRFDNISYLNQCLHRFCFRCIKEWSKNKAECPLCKQPFHSILHSVRAENDFKEYTLRPSDNGSFASPNGQRFRYRTTLTRSDRMLLRPRRTMSPPDNGIIFEGLTSHQPQQSEGRIHSMVLRLAARRRIQADGRSNLHYQEQEVINFRRALYRTGVRVRNVQDGGRYRDISAEFFRRNPACLHRLVPWLKRELTVLFGAHGSLVNIVQHIIMSNVTRYDMESQAFAEDLRPFLLQRTDHFLHEFITFAQSPFNMDAYDQHASYDWPAPSYEESHSDSSVITISPDEADPLEPDVTTLAEGTDQAPWDDETPGPSYSSTDLIQPISASPITSYDSSDEELAQPTSSAQPDVQVKSDPGPNDDNVNSSSEEDCVVVGYVKPLAERTPELVELSSNSDMSVHEEDTKNIIQPQHINFSSGRDSSSFSTSRSSASKDRHKVHKKSKKREKNRQRRRSGSSVVDMTKDYSRSQGGRRTHDREVRSRTRERSRSIDSYWSQSRDENVDKVRRKHYNKERPKYRRSRSRERVRHRDSRDKKRSRSRDKSLSRRSRTVSITSESTASRDRGRSRSWSSDRGRLRSWSRDREYSYVKDKYQNTFYPYFWDSCSHDKDRDNYDSFYRKKIHSKSYPRRRSRSPNNRIRYSSEHRSSYKENSYRHCERYRSRSRSSSSGMDRHRHEKPSGKRKYKTRHLENIRNGSTVSSCVCTSSTREDGPSHRSPSKYSGSCRNDSDLSVKTASSESKFKKRKKKSRSPSVEIVYEGKATDASKHHKKKKRKHKKKHKRHRTGEQPKSSSPLVITIDSDSSEGVPANTVCDRSSDNKNLLKKKKNPNEHASSETADNKNFHVALGDQPIFCKDTGSNFTTYSEATSSTTDSGIKKSSVEQTLTVPHFSNLSDGENSLNNVEMPQLELNVQERTAPPVSDSGNHINSVEIPQLELQDIQERTSLPIFDSLNTLNNVDGLNTLHNVALEQDGVQERTALPEDSSEFSDRPRLIIKLPKRLLDRTCLPSHTEEST